MVKAETVPEAPQGADGELYLIAMPMSTYRALSDIAKARGMTFAQALGTALNEFIQKSEQAPGNPRLLVENRK